MVGRISAGEIFLRVRGRDCLKYLKVGEIKKRGGETKFLKKGGKLGQGVGLLKKGGGAGTLLSKDQSQRIQNWDQESIRKISKWVEADASAQSQETQKLK